MTTDLLALFSDEKFSCLDFDNVASIDKAQRQAVAESMDEVYCVQSTINTLLCLRTPPSAKTVGPGDIPG